MCVMRVVTSNLQHAPDHVDSQTDEDDGDDGDDSSGRPTYVKPGSQSYFDDLAIPSRVTTDPVEPKR